DRLEGKFWVHTGVVEAKPHEGHVELVPVLHDALGHLFRGADEDSLLLELIEVEVVPFARLAPTRVRLILRAQRVLHLLLGAPAVLGNVHLAEERESFEWPSELLQQRAIAGQRLSDERPRMTAARDPSISDIGDAG